MFYTIFTKGNAFYDYLLAFYKTSTNKLQTIGLSDYPTIPLRLFVIVYSRLNMDKDVLTG